MTNNILEKILDKADKELSNKVLNENLVIDNIILGRSYFRKTNFSKALGDMAFYLVILDQGDSGFAYFNITDKKAMHNEHLSYINQSAIKIAREIQDLPLKTAIIDAITGVYNKTIKIQEHKTIKVNGSYANKASVRASLLTEDIVPNEKILLVGAVSEIAREIISKKGNLRISDLSKERENSYLYGIPIEVKNGITIEIMKEVDTAVITGATFSSGTIDKILEAGKKHNTKMIFYLETANNFGPHLITSGAHKVIAEKFPFYDMPGTTIMEIYSNDKIF
jgi:uncharacterized protein (DUF4213/DUF364 family)